MLLGTAEQAGVEQVAAPGRYDPEASPARSTAALSAAQARRQIDAVDQHAPACAIAGSEYIYSRVIRPIEDACGSSAAALGACQVPAGGTSTATRSAVRDQHAPPADFARLHAVRRSRPGEPDQAAAPVQVTSVAERLRQRRSTAGPADGRTETRQIASRSAGERRHVAHRRHTLARLPRRRGFRRRRTASSRAAVRCGRRPTRRNPRSGSARRAASCERSGNRDAASRRQTRRRRTRRTANPAPPTAPPRRCSASRPGSTSVPAASGAGSTFSVISVMHAERAVAAGQQLA